MSEYAPETCRITTIENYEKRIPIARENIKKAGREQQITLLPGDAQQIMRTLNGPYDFVFMDAAKGQYLNFLPEVMRLLAAGGLLVSDNVLPVSYTHLDVYKRQILTRVPRCWI